MKKIHTRAKRKLYVATHIKHVKRLGRNKPKAFKSEEKALEWAKKNSLKDFELKNLREKGKPKIKFVIKN